MIGCPNLLDTIRWCVRGINFASNGWSVVEVKYLSTSKHEVSILEVFMCYCWESTNIATRLEHSWLALHNAPCRAFDCTFLSVELESVKKQIDFSSIFFHFLLHQSCASAYHDHVCNFVPLLVKLFEFCLCLFNGLFVSICSPC